MKWSQFEISILLKSWATLPKSELIGLLPTRTWKSISRKCESLSLKRSRSDTVQIGFTPEWLIGELLGDGHITKNGRYSHTTKYHEYAEFLGTLFFALGARYRIKDEWRHERRTDKLYFRSLFRTRTNFKAQRLLWYPADIKRVPANLRLSDESFLHWVLGDGSITKINVFYLCTMGFVRSDIDLLVGVLSRFGLKCRVRKDNTIFIPRIAFNKDRLKQFIDTQLIYPPCYHYKIVRLMRWVGCI